MTLTNGQDQLAEFKRARGRQALEHGRKERSLLPVIKSEERGLTRPQLEPFEYARARARYEGTLLEPQSVWSARVEITPETAHRDFPPAGISVRSRQKPTGLAEGYKNVCDRWSVDALGMARILHLEEEIGLCDLVLSGQVPPITGDLKDRMAFVIGISIGLGELFDDDKDGELQWLNSARSKLGDVSPLEHMLKGDLLHIRDVVDLLDNARGLK